MNPTSRAIATIALAAAVAALCIPGCDNRPPTAGANSDSKLKVFVSILPQAYFVKRIGGEHVQIEVLIGPGQSEHSYEPTPRQMLGLADSKIYFPIGVSAEKRFVEQAPSINKNLKIVPTQAGITLRKMGRDEASTDPPHDHAHAEDDHDHDHEIGGDDPHIWLDPTLVKIQAQTICTALAEIDPAHAADYASNLKSFDADLDAIDAKIAHALAPLKGKEVYVFHPSYGYFCDRYGLKQVAVEYEGKEPGFKQIEEIAIRAKAGGARVVFYQPQFSKQPAEAVARRIGGAAIAMDPLAEDYLNNLDSMAVSIERALSQPASATGPAGDD